MNRFTCGALPDDGCLALVGDTDGGEVSVADLGFCPRFADNLARALPYFQRVMLYPTTLREDLAMFTLVIGDHIALRVKEHKAGACCAGIKCANQTGHRASLGWLRRAAKQWA